MSSSHLDHPFKEGDSKAKRPRVNPTIVSQHFEEAAFLWFVRAKAVSAPNYYLEDLVNLDNRIDGHFDGLMIAGDFAWEHGGKGVIEEGELFALAVLAFFRKDAARVEFVRQHLGEEALVAPVVSAFSGCQFNSIEGLLRAWSADASPLVRCAALGGFLAHRVPPPDQVMMASSHDSDASLRAQAFRLVGDCQIERWSGVVQSALRDEDPVARFYAIRSASLLGVRGRQVVDPLKDLVMSKHTIAEDAVDLMMRITLPAYGATVCRYLLNEAGRPRLAAKAACALGDPDLLPEMVRLMNNEETARVGGEAFAQMTGLDLAFEDLERDGPQEAAGEEADLLFEDPDEDLPWPDINRIREWWEKNGHPFRGQTRFMRGEPVSELVCTKALTYGTQSQRRAAALELALSRPRSGLFHVEGPAAEQKRRLGVEG